MKGTNSKYVPPHSRKKAANAPENESQSLEAQKQQRRARFLHKPKEDYGFVSRGDDNRLQASEKARRDYFDSILESFDSGDDNSAVLAGLRKVREALLHRKPDEFAKSVFLFSVRVGSTLGHYQTYIPSINYLLSEAQSLLSESEREEIAALLVLHVSHCNNDGARALSVFHEHFESKHTKTYRALMAWIQQDYVLWLSLYNAETNPSHFAVMTLGLQRMMEHMVVCFDAAFFTYSKHDFESLLPKATTWATFREKYGVKWEEQEEVLVIRRRK